MSEFIRDAPIVSYVLWVAGVALLVVWYVLLVQRGVSFRAAEKQRDAGVPTPPPNRTNGPNIVNAVAWAMLLAGCALAVFA